MRQARSMFSAGVRPAGIALAVSASLACGIGEGTDRGQVIETDSAGLRIVTSSGGGWASSESWSLGEPAVVLGGESGTEDMWQIRGYARTPDGGAVALSGGGREIHVFDASGERVLTFGREGEGPGELSFPISMALVAPDTLVVLDQLEREVFLLDGTWVGSEPGGLVRDVFGPATGFQPLWIMAERTLFGRVLRRSNQQQARPSGVYRPPEEFAVMRGDDAPSIVSAHGGLEQERMDFGGAMRNVVAPFARSTVVGVSPWPEPRILVSDNERYEIDLFDTSGRLEMRVRREVEPIHVREEWVEAWKDAQRDMSWTRGQLDQLEIAWNRMTVRSTLPALEGLALDSLGHIWVQRPGTLPRQDVVFDVFAPEGGFLGEVVVPPGLRWTPMPRIGGDYFMGVWTEDLDVESVRIYRLDRGG